MTKKVAILQSNYLPWIGYFDLIGKVDEFVIYDEAAYTKNDWRNRNKIKGPNGVFWLTVPVKIAGKNKQKICEAEAVNLLWIEKHWQSIYHCYHKASFFNRYQKYIRELYGSIETTNLSRINLTFIKGICELLNIETKISTSEDYSFEGNKTEKLIDICRQANATTYLSGPAAKSYLNTDLFEKEKIEVEWMTYRYPEYQQLFPPFEAQVSVLDLLFNLGPDSVNFINR